MHPGAAGPASRSAGSVLHNVVALASQASRSRLQPGPSPFPRQPGAPSGAGDRAAIRPPGTRPGPARHCRRAAIPRLPGRLPPGSAFLCRHRPVILNLRRRGRAAQVPARVRMTGRDGRGRSACVRCQCPGGVHRSGGPRRAAAGRERDTFPKDAAAEPMRITVEHLEVGRRAWRRFGRGDHPAAPGCGECFDDAHAEVAVSCRRSLAKASPIRMSWPRDRARKCRAASAKARVRPRPFPRVSDSGGGCSLAVTTCLATVARQPSAHFIPAWTEDLAGSRRAVVARRVSGKPPLRAPELETADRAPSCPRASRRGRGEPGRHGEDCRCESSIQPCCGAQQQGARPAPPAGRSSHLLTCS